MKIFEGKIQIEPCFRLVEFGGDIRVALVDESGEHIVNLLEISEEGVSRLFCAKSRLVECGYNTDFIEWNNDGSIKIIEGSK